MDVQGQPYFRKCSYKLKQRRVRIFKYASKSLADLRPSIFLKFTLCCDLDSYLNKESTRDKNVFHKNLDWDIFRDTSVLKFTRSSGREVNNGKRTE